MRLQPEVVGAVGPRVVGDETLCLLPALLVVEQLERTHLRHDNSRTDGEPPLAPELHHRQHRRSICLFFHSFNVLSYLLLPKLLGVIASLFNVNEIFAVVPSRIADPWLL